MFRQVEWAGRSTVCAPSVFAENVAVNLKRGLEELGQPRGPLYVACAGPSLRDTAEQLRGKKPIWALNAAHDYLISRGIIPAYGVAQAPEHQILDTFKMMRPDVTYLFASCTHPDLVDRAVACGARVVLWHCAQPEEWAIDYGTRDFGTFIHGTGTIGMRTLDLAHMVGFRDLHVHGFDACCSPDMRIGPEQTIYADREKDVRVFEGADGKFYPALPSHARQVEDIDSVIKHLPGLKLTFYGEGLMQARMKGRE